MNASEQPAEALPVGAPASKASWGTDALPNAAAELARRPELLADKSAVLDLAYEEFCQRAEAGRAPDPESFCARFPAYRSSLRRLLTAHQFLAANSELLRAAPPARWPEPGQRWGDWTLLRELGRGAFARVYLATEASTGDRPVAVKLSFEGGAEARTLGRLNHPNVVPILSARSDADSGLTAVCMPFLGGATLTDVLDRAYPAPGDAPPRAAGVILEAARVALRPGDPAPDAPPPDRRLPPGSYEEGVALVGLGLAEALAFLHARQVFHLDLKPSNVLLGTDGRPLLLDFNLSADGRNATPRVGGTLPYMAPEQIEALTAGGADSGALDGRADLFSLGVILYELLTGVLPFGPVPALATRELAPLLLARQRAGFRPVRAAAPRTARGLAALAQRCLAFDRAARPASAEDVAAALRRFLAGVRRKRVLRRLAWLLPGAAAAALLGARLALGPGPAELGRTAFGAGDYARAEKHFGQAVTANPGDARVLWSRALTRLKLSESQTLEDARPGLRLALEEFQAANAANPRPRTRACIAYCLSRLTMYDDAVHEYDKADAEGYHTAILYNNRAYIHLLRNKPEAAAKDLDEALRLDPGLAAAYYNRATLTYRHWLQNPNAGALAASRADMAAALRLGLRSPDLFWDAAHLALAAGEKTEALSLLGSAVEWGKKPSSIAADRDFNQSLSGLRAVLGRRPNGQPCPAAPRLVLPANSLDD